MKSRIENLLAAVHAADLTTPDQVEAFRIDFLGRKGKIKDLMAAFKEVPGPEKRELGPLLNALKQAVDQKIKNAQAVTTTVAKASGQDSNSPFRRHFAWDASPFASGSPRDCRHLSKHGFCGR